MTKEQDWNKEYRELHELGRRCARCRNPILSSSVDLDGETICVKCFQKQYAPGRYKVAPKSERTWNGITFHSKREMENHIKFDALRKGGKILKLERQVPYPLFAAKPVRLMQTIAGDWVRCGEAVTVSKYIADHVTIELDGKEKIYETKGHRSAGYKLAKKWFGVCYSHLEIIEI